MSLNGVKISEFIYETLTDAIIDQAQVPLAVTKDGVKLNRKIPVIELKGYQGYQGHQGLSVKGDQGDQGLSVKGDQGYQGYQGKSVNTITHIMDTIGIGSLSTSSLISDVITSLNTTDTSNYITSLGRLNTIATSDGASILGGYVNSITNSVNSVICGGGGESSDGGNTIINSINAGILAGIENTINGAMSAIIVGGNFNYISSALTVGDYSFIGAGIGNIIKLATYSIIGGGYYNIIDATLFPCINSFIGGGSTNQISYQSNYSCIVGGFSHYIFNSEYSCILGGEDNAITNSKWAVIGGGTDNYILNGQLSNIIGVGNTITDASYSSINGYYNHNTGFDSVHILGNGITANRSTSTFVNGFNIDGALSLSSTGSSSKSAAIDRVLAVSSVSGLNDTVAVIDWKHPRDLIWENINISRSYAVDNYESINKLITTIQIDPCAGMVEGASTNERAINILLSEESYALQPIGSQVMFFIEPTTTINRYSYISIYSGNSWDSRISVYTIPAGLAGEYAYTSIRGTNNWY